MSEPKILNCLYQPRWKQKQASQMHPLNLIIFDFLIYYNTPTTHFKDKLTFQYQAIVRIPLQVLGIRVTM